MSVTLTNGNRSCILAEYYRAEQFQKVVDWGLLPEYVKEPPLHQNTHIHAGLHFNDKNAK